MDSREFKDLYSEHRIFNRRALICWVSLIIFTGLLALRLFYLQVVEYDRYVTLSDNNRVLLQALAPNRGLIYDRNGVLLAENRASHSLNVTMERIRDLEKTLTALGELIPVTERDIERFKERVKEPRRPYESVPLRFKLTEQEIAKIAVHSHELAGVSIEAQLVRHYPLGDSTAHVLGYVGRINQQEQERIDERNYSATRFIGKIGLEKFYEEQLHGKVGYQKVETNARGRVLRTLERSAPTPGEDVHLHLDSNLQQAAEQALGERRGAIVAIDPQSGGILALVSKPSFDPNLFVTGIDTRSYGLLRDSPDLPLFNRALRGQYPPGSTIKPFVALAGLETGHADWEREIFDPGWYQLKKDGRLYRDWKKWGHGRVDMHLALVQSCDTYFYELAHRMGVDSMHDFLGRFGFGQRTGLDMAESLGGILPSTDWKKMAVGEPWYTGDSLNASIGQGFMLATPLQLATATAVLANRGVWFQPRLMQDVVKHSADPLELVDDRELKPLEDVAIKDSEDWRRIITAMEDVVHGERGTAKGISKGIEYKVAGKTGTAQVVGIGQDEENDAETIEERKPHALFIAFAPIEEPAIALVVIVENGGGGGATAAPVAREVLDAWLDRGETG